MGSYGLYSSGSGRGKLAGSCGHEPCVPYKEGNILTSLVIVASIIFISYSAGMMLLLYKSNF